MKNMFVIDYAFPIAKTHTKNMIHVTISRVCALTEGDPFY